MGSRRGLGSRDWECGGCGLRWELCRQMNLFSSSSMFRRPNGTIVHKHYWDFLWDLEM